MTIGSLISQNGKGKHTPLPAHSIDESLIFRKAPGGPRLSRRAHDGNRRLMADWGPSKADRSKDVARAVDERIERIRSPSDTCSTPLRTQAGRAAVHAPAPPPRCSPTPSKPQGRSNATSLISAPEKRRDVSPCFQATSLHRETG